MTNPQVPQYGQPPAQPQKKPFYKRVWFIILMIIVVIAVLAAIFGGGDDDSSSSSSSSSSTQEGNAGGEQATNDGVAQLGDTVHTDKADITATNLRPVTDALGGQYMCVDVTFNVTGDDELSLNGAMDWELTDPAGVTHSQTFTTEASYDTVKVGPGGTYSGTACFDGDGAPGEYKLSFEEAMTFMNAAKGEWNATI